jgi:preprotein translocase subunit SecD
MRRLAGAIFAVVCVWPFIAVAQAAETAEAVGRSTLLLGLQMRGGSTEERLGVLLKSAELIRRRLAIEGIGDARVVPVGEDRIQVSAPGAETLRRVTSQLIQIPKLSFRLLDNKGSAREALAGNVPLGDELLWAVDDSGRDARPLLVQFQEWLTGKDIEHADADDNNGVGFLPLVNIHFDTAGRQVLAQVTSGNSGRKLAVVWGNKIIGVYIIEQPILDGILPVHTWNDGAEDLATILNMSAMVTPLTVLEEHSDEQTPVLR